MIAYQLTPEKRDMILDSIKDHFESERPYLKPGYSLRDLAEELGITYTYLSYIINREYGMNFNNLVNKYRVAHLQQLMKQPDASMYTLEALAQRAGFNSRSTFYRAFYKTTGRMPSSFAKALNGQ